MREVVEDHALMIRKRNIIIDDRSGQKSVPEDTHSLLLHTYVSAPTSSIAKPVCMTGRSGGVVFHAGRDVSTACGEVGTAAKGGRSDGFSPNPACGK